jgi:hypothetical protein
MIQITSREIAALTDAEKRHMVRWLNEDAPILAAQHIANARIGLAERMIEAGAEEVNHD